MGAAKAPSILILNAEGDLPRSVYDPVLHVGQHLQRLNHRCRSVGVHDKLAASQLDGSSHLIITGSSASLANPMQYPRWLQSAMDFIAAAMDRNMPVLGICFGHQLLAHLLGGEQAVGPSSIPEVGWYASRNQVSDDVLGSQNAEYWAYNLHYDEVVALPQDVHIVAASASCAIQSFRVKDWPVWGVQSHPKITPAQEIHIMRSAYDVFSEEKRRYLDHALKSTPRDSGYIDPLLRAFVEPQGN
jgi:GMP synthase-like glutamine amidotransferase